MFKQQLRALVRAGMHHPITVLFPMVTTIDELRTARALLAEAAVEVGSPSGELPLGFEVGAMAEVPGFALHARAAAALVDLLSIGTNDLTQYTLAAERETPTLLPSPIRSTPRSCTSSPRSPTRPPRRPGSRCAASWPRTPPRPALLVGLGVRELSMTPRAIPAVKHAIRSMSANKAKQLAALALRSRLRRECSGPARGPCLGLGPFSGPAPLWLFGHGLRLEQMLEAAEDEQALHGHGRSPNLQRPTGVTPADRVPEDRGESTRVHEVDRREIDDNVPLGLDLVECRGELVGRADVELATNGRHS